MLYEFLKDNYKEGEPIFTEDIAVEGRKKANRNQQLKGLADKGLIRRFDKGVYFIPRKACLSSAAGPSADEVARDKFVMRGEVRIGYYSGSTFANQLGIYCSKQDHTRQRRSLYPFFSGLYIPKLL